MRSGHAVDFEEHRCNAFVGEFRLLSVCRIAGTSGGEEEGVDEGGAWRDGEGERMVGVGHECRLGECERRRLGWSVSGCWWLSRDFEGPLG